MAANDIETTAVGTSDEVTANWRVSGAHTLAQDVFPGLRIEEAPPDLDLDTVTHDHEHVSGIVNTTP